MYSLFTNPGRELKKGFHSQIDIYNKQKGFIYNISLELVEKDSICIGMRAK
jgi:hypothetical protein